MEATPIRVGDRVVFRADTSSNVFEVVGGDGD